MPTRWPAADYQGLVKEALKTAFPDVTSRADRKLLYNLVSNGAGDTIRKAVLANPALVGTTQRFWVVAADDMDMLSKGFIKRDLPEAQRVVSDTQIGWFDELDEKRPAPDTFNTTFLSAGDSREPEQAGILGALMGSIFTMLVTVLLALPLGCHERHLSRGIRAEEPAHRDHRGQHQQSGGVFPPSCSVFWAWPCCSASSACRARHRWWVAWCWR